MKFSTKFKGLILVLWSTVHTEAYDLDSHQQRSSFHNITLYCHEAVLLLKDFFVPSETSFFGHDLLEALESTRCRGEFASLMDRLLMDKNPRFIKADLFNLIKSYRDDDHPDLKLIDSLPNPKKLQLWHYIQENLELSNHCQGLQEHLKDSLLEFWWRPDMEQTYPLTEVLRGPFKKLKFSGVSLTPENLKMLQSNSSVEEVSFKKSPLKNSAAKLYGEYLARLKILRFVNCWVGTDFIVTFMAELKNSSTLTGLYVSNTLLTLTDAQAIAGYLRTTSTLERLHLVSATLSSTGGLAIVQALENHKSLQYLNLSRNPLEDDVAQALTTVLKSNQSLNEIFLEKTGMVNGQTAIGLIKVLIERDIEIKSLDLSDIPLSPNEARVIANNLSQKKVIHKLQMTDSGIKHQEAVVFAKLMITPQAPTLLNISPVEGIAEIAKSALKEKYPKLVGTFLF